ncbi:MAG: M20/M25/M40 family metallo-hydrolase [Oscillospiraceae bacterium]|nr:M20/M25/M40 family metallo-hydrolase [Oscillospiraceae bacterium]
MKKILLPTILAILVFVTFTCSVYISVGNKNLYKIRDDFDMDRVFDTLTEISREPRPRGSATHQRVLDFVYTELASYGTEPVIIEYMTTYEDAVRLGGYGEEYTLIPDTKVTNILVEFTGEKSDDILLFAAHTDSVPMGAGAGDAGVPVAAMLEVIRQIKTRELTFDNTVVFLFTDGEEEGLLGAYLFAERRQPVNNVDSRFVNLMDDVKFVANWECRGTGGMLNMFETTNGEYNGIPSGNYNTVKHFAKINDNIFANSITDFVYSQMPNGTDFSAFSEQGVQGLNFANLGEGYNYHTANDNVGKLSDLIVAQNGNMMLEVLYYFGNLDLNTLYGVENSAVFYTWLNLFTFYYPPWVAVAFGVLSLLLIATALFLNARLRKYSLKGLLLALLSNIAAVVISLLMAFLVRSGLALIPVYGRLLGSYSFSHWITVLGFLFLTLGVYVAVLAVMNKWLSLKYKSTPQYLFLANCIFMGAIGSLGAVFAPELSILFSPAGFVGAVILALNMGVKRDISKFYLGVIPCICMLPLAVPLAILASDALGLTLGWALGIVPVLALGFIIPYLFEIESPIKVISKINRLVAGGFILAGLVLILSLAAFPLNLSTNIYEKASGIHKLFNDDTIIYRYDLETDSGIFIMYDQSAYEYLEREYGLTGRFDAELNGYVLALDGVADSDKLAEPEIITSYNGEFFEIDVRKVSDSEGAFSLFFPLNASDSGAYTNITRIEVEDENGKYLFEAENFMEYMTERGEIKFRSFSDSIIRVYTNNDNALLFGYTENYYLDFDGAVFKAPKSIEENEINLKTGVEVYKWFFIAR